MNLLKQVGNFFTKNKEQNQQPQQLQATSKLKGKIIKDYTLEDKITSFDNPHTQLVVGLKAPNTKVSVYGLQKKNITQQSFIAYQNTLANNYAGVYPQYLQHIQSANFIYIILEQLTLPENKNWMAEDFLDRMEQLSSCIKQKISINGILVNSKKKLLYFPPYQDLKSVSKFYYQGINNPVFAQLFCKVFQLPQNQRKKAYEAIVQYSGTKQLKKYVLRILSSSNRSLNNQKYQKPPAFSNQSPLNFSPQKKFNQPTQINSNNQDTLYPDLAADDEQIMKLISVVRTNPNLIQQASHFHQMRASSRARHEQNQQTQQIKDTIDHANKSMFQINKVVKKSAMKSKYQIIQNQKKISQNQFQLYCTTYISIFKHFKRTLKSGLSYYSKGFSGIISAYFITLIGVLRRSKLVYALNNEIDVFGIGCQSYNVEFYTGKLKKQLLSQAKILTDLRQMIYRCYIPMKTFQILAPYLDDHIENINLAKLQDFCFFYLTSLLRGNFKKQMHFINAIEFMYIILHRNFQIVHFEDDMPKKWDDQFFQLRKQLIQSMVPNWSI